MKSSVRSVVKRTAAVADLARPTDGIAVLIYHRVGARTGVSVDLPRSLFAEQMAVLAERFRPLTLDQAADELEAGKPAGARPAVVVTFDDGTADFLDEAVPVLAEHGVPAVTCYLATDHLESQRPFPDDGVPMSWAAAREALDSGVVTFGSHTHSHALLDRIPPEAAAEELDRSIELIGARLGVDARHFAYPKALLASAAVEPEVRKRFRTAAIARTRPNRHGSADLHRLTRSPVQVSDGMRWFERKANGGMRPRGRHARSGEPVALPRRVGLTWQRCRDRSG